MARSYASKPEANVNTTPSKKANTLSAAGVINTLKLHASKEEQTKMERYFKSGEGQYGEGDHFMGVRMGTVFNIAKENLGMASDELEKLLEDPVHEVRTVAVSIMNQLARKNSLAESERKKLYDLYIGRHDRINNWDLVDLGCIYVIGRYLYDKPRDILFRLATSDNMWERRTAIVSTAYFIRKGDINDTFKIAEMLVRDNEDLVHKATGGWIREAGRKMTYRPALLDFLTKHAATMPRTMLRYAVEHLDPDTKKHYMEMKVNKASKK